MRDSGWVASSLSLSLFVSEMEMVTSVLSGYFLKSTNYVSRKDEKQNKMKSHIHGELCPHIEALRHVRKRLSKLGKRAVIKLKKQDRKNGYCWIKPIIRPLKKSTRPLVHLIKERANVEVKRTGSETREATSNAEKICKFGEMMDFIYMNK